MKYNICSLQPTSSWVPRGEEDVPVGWQWRQCLGVHLPTWLTVEIQSRLESMTGKHYYSSQSSPVQLTFNSRHTSRSFDEDLFVHQFQMQSPLVSSAQLIMALVRRVRAARTRRPQYQAGRGDTEPSLTYLIPHLIPHLIPSAPGSWPPVSVSRAAWPIPLHLIFQWLLQRRSDHKNRVEKCAKERKKIFKCFIFCFGFHASTGEQVHILLVG